MRWLLVALLGLHGLIHLIGSPAAWGGAIAGLAADPLIPLAGATLRLAGVAWLLAAVLLVVAALGLALRRGWWRAVALAGVIVSQVLIVLWWRDARVGTLPNLVIVVATICFSILDRRPAGLAVSAQS